MRKVIDGNGADSTGLAQNWLLGNSSLVVCDLYLFGDPEDPRSIRLTNHESPIVYPPWGTFLPAVVTRDGVTAKVGLDVQSLTITWSPAQQSSTQNTGTASPSQLARLHFYDNWPVRIFKVFLASEGDNVLPPAAAAAGGLPRAPGFASAAPPVIPLLPGQYVAWSFATEVTFWGTALANLRGGLMSVGTPFFEGEIRWSGFPWPDLPPGAEVVPSGEGGIYGLLRCAASGAATDTGYPAYGVCEPAGPAPTPGAFPPTNFTLPMSLNFVDGKPTFLSDYMQTHIAGSWAPGGQPPSAWLPDALAYIPRGWSYAISFVGVAVLYTLPGGGGGGGGGYGELALGPGGSNSGDAITLGATQWWGGRIDTVQVERNKLSLNCRSFLDVVSQKVPSTVIEVTNTMASSMVVTVPAGDAHAPVFACYTGSTADYIIADCTSPTANKIYSGNQFAGGYMVFLSGPGATLAGCWSAIGQNGAFTDGHGNKHTEFEIYSALPWPPTPGVDTFYVSATAPIDIGEEGYYGFPFVPSPQSGV